MTWNFVIYTLCKFYCSLNEKKIVTVHIFKDMKRILPCIKIDTKPIYKKQNDYIFFYSKIPFNVLI